MRFILCALALMAIISTASAQLDQFMTMQLIKNMQQQNKKGGGHGLSGNLAAMMGMSDIVPDIGDIMMNNYLMNQMKGRNTGTKGASGGGLMGGMNPFLAASMDNSDLALWSMMNKNNNQQNAKHNRAQMFQNPLASAMMLDTMFGNDLGTSMEGLGAMALMGGTSPMMGMSPPMMGSAYPNYNFGATTPNYGATTPAPYAYPQRPEKYYAPHPSPRGRPHQYMPMGMGGGMGSPMGMGGMGNPMMKNMFMMDAMSGGDIFPSDFAKDYGGMMMMQNMMRPHRPQMGYGYNPYQQYQYPGYYYPAQPASSSAHSPSNSRIKDNKFTGKRGGIYDNLWEMNLISNWLNPNPGTGAGAGGAGIDPASIAFAEMATGDSFQNPPAEQKEGATQLTQDPIATATDVGGTGTSSDAVVVDPKGQQ